MKSVKKHVKTKASKSKTSERKNPKQHSEITSKSCSGFGCIAQKWIRLRKSHVVNYLLCDLMGSTS